MAGKSKPILLGATIVGFIVLVSVGVTLVAVYTPFCMFKAYKIPSSAMEPILTVGDHILAKRFCFSNYQPSRGDIVVFTLAEAPNVPLLKRIVGLPGERIEVVGDEVKVDGEVLEEPYAQWVAGGQYDYREDGVVPEGNVFVMGDNRDRSKDSRFWEDPFLPIDRITEKALLIYHPRERLGMWLNQNPYPEK